jgi:hypothetical protein
MKIKLNQPILNNQVYVMFLHSALITTVLLILVIDGIKLLLPFFDRNGLLWQGGD